LGLAKRFRRLQCYYSFNGARSHSLTAPANLSNSHNTFEKPLTSVRGFFVFHRLASHSRAFIALLEAGGKIQLGISTSKLYKMLIVIKGFYENMTVAGKLEVTIKINELPAISSEDKNGWKCFEVDCDGRIFSVTVKPKVFKKLEEAQANYPQWVAAIAGKLGETTEQGFVLAEANIQVFEKKPKEGKQVEAA
jgi:hypothetical protein